MSFQDDSHIGWHTVAHHATKGMVLLPFLLTHTAVQVRLLNSKARALLVSGTPSRAYRRAAGMPPQARTTHTSKNPTISIMSLVVFICAMHMLWLFYTESPVRSFIHLCSWCFSAPDTVSGKLNRQGVVLLTCRLKNKKGNQTLSTKNR